MGSAGCLGSGGANSSSTSPTVSEPNTDAATTPANPGDADLPLAESDLVRAARTDQIPAITDPAFGEDWTPVPETLGERDRVIGVEVDGTARAYPLPILNWHEVVNDDFGGPLLVTYCPLCGSGVTAERRVDGRETGFGVSGYLWQRDLVLYDDLTGSLWSQILGQAVRGPRTGETLSLRPSTLTTWGEWRESHPGTSVLLPPPESETVGPNGERNYNTNPYSGYEDSQPVDFSVGESNRRLPPRALVLGIVADGTARAYPFKTVLEADGVVTDRVGDRPVVVASTHDSLVAYDRRVDDRTLSVDRAAGALLAGDSRWDPVSGRALDGPYEGATLQRANDRSPMFWFAWADFFPDSGIYGRSVPADS